MTMITSNRADKSKCWYDIADMEYQLQVGFFTFMLNYSVRYCTQKTFSQTFHWQQQQHKPNHSNYDFSWKLMGYLNNLMLL